MRLSDAAGATRTGDVWLFRGRSGADRAIQTLTNSPVNHVGMAVVLDDLPPLMWHAELGRSLPDVWAGGHRRGAQLHDLEAAVGVWAGRYGQRAWVRQLAPEVTRSMEDGVLRTIARLDGTPFPSSTGMAARWLAGRGAGVRRRLRPRQASGSSASGSVSSASVPSASVPSASVPSASVPSASVPSASVPSASVPSASVPSASGSAEPGSAVAALETAYCAEVVAVTYQAMGLLPADVSPGWYDPGRFWSGDDLDLLGGHRLGAEIAVVP